MFMSLFLFIFMIPYFRMSITMTREFVFVGNLPLNSLCPRFYNLPKVIFSPKVILSRSKHRNPTFDGLRSGTLTRGKNRVD